MHGVIFPQFADKDRITSFPQWRTFDPFLYL